MSDYEWSSDWKPEFTLGIAPDFSIYDDGKGSPVGIFYHSSDDEAGIELEVRVRRQIQEYFDEVGGQDDTETLELAQERLDAPQDCIVPVVNTTDVRGVLEGEVEFAPAYKHFADFTGEDAIATLEFVRNWVALFREEQARMAEYVEYLRRRGEE
jgi:hypothetical protein